MCYCTVLAINAILDVKEIVEHCFNDAKLNRKLRLNSKDYTFVILKHEERRWSSDHKFQENF